MADLPKLARIGHTIECDVRHPFQWTIRMALATTAATAYGNELLLDPTSGWRLSSLPQVQSFPLTEEQERFLNGGGATPQTGQEKNHG